MKIDKKKIAIVLNLLACGGVVVTGICASKAGAKANKKIEDLKSENPDISKREIVKEVAPIYIPTIFAGCLTIGCIAGSAITGRLEIRDITTMYCMAQAKRIHQNDVLVKKHGLDEFENIQDIANANELKGVSTFVESDDAGMYMFKEEITETMFKATLSDVLLAELELNRMLQVNGTATAADWLMYLGIYDEKKHAKYKETGWSTYAENDYRYRWIDFYHKPRNTNKHKDKQYILISLPFGPTKDFEDL